MRRHQKIYNPYHLLSAVFMILALLWLTISAPFVYANWQEHASENRVANNDCLPSGGEEDANPFSNTTEEKSPNSTFSEEYLHDHHASDCFFSIILRQHKCENADTYHAFHGELLVPPPNAA